MAITPDPGFQVATYAAARLLVGGSAGEQIYIHGRTAENDGGQGLFEWVPSGTTSVNDGIALSATGGIWQRISKIITYEMFGAVAMTGASQATPPDSTTAINACHAAMPAPSGNVIAPFIVLVQGLYGVSATINFNLLMGVIFEGLSSFSEAGSGYVWIGALSNTTHTLFISQCRYIKMKHLRVTTNSETSTRANAQLSAICLTSDYTTSIQQECVFEDVIIGNRDSYDSLGATGTYQFISGFTGQTITGTYGNNDAHVFKSVRMQAVGIGWNNQDSQSVGWILKDCKVQSSDTFLSQKASTTFCYNIEADNINGPVFILGASGADTNTLRVNGLITQTNFGRLLTNNGPLTFSIADGIFDQNRNPASQNVVNPADPYFIVDTSGNNSVITLERFLFPSPPGIQPIIDYGTSAALKQLVVKGGHPDTIAIRNYGSMGQDQRIVYHWEPGDDANGSWSLAAADWAPFTQLLYPPYILIGPICTLGSITAGSSYNGGGTATFPAVALTGGTGSGATATITVTSGAVTAVVITAFGTGYTVTDSLSASVASLGNNGGSGFHIPVATNAIVADYTTSELPTQTVRCGRRNISACTDIKSRVTAGTPGAGATYTFTNALPVGLILGVSLCPNYCPGPASFNIGDGTTAARWGNLVVGGTLANPPTGSLIAAYTDASPVYNKAVGNVVLTAVGGSFSGGGSPMQITVNYIDFAQRFYNANGSG